MDTSTGPIPRDEFKALADLPFGGARKAIRKYDPLWGVEDGTPIKWRITASRVAREEGFATVEAATKEEAEALAEKLGENEFSWDHAGSDGDFEIWDVEPKK